MTNSGGGIWGAVKKASLPERGGGSGGGSFSMLTLVDAATITWDLSQGQVAQVTLGGNRTLGLPTNITAGGTYMLYVIQDGTGNRTLSMSNFKQPTGVAYVPSTGAGQYDVLTFASKDGVTLDLIGYNKNFS